MRKLRIASAVIAAVLGALIVAAMFVEFDASGLGRRVLEAAGRNAGITLQARRVRLHLRHGFVLEEVVATTEIASGTVVTTVDRVVLEHRLWPLLLGNIVVDNLIMESPVIEVHNAGSLTASTAGHRDDERRQPAAPTAAPITVSGATTRAATRRQVARIIPISLTQESAPVAALARDVVVHAASIIDGTLLVLAPDGTPTTTVTGLDAEVSDINVDARAGSIAVGLKAHGHIDVGEVRFADRIGTGNRAQLVASDGIYTVSELALTTTDGSVSLDKLVVDVTRNPYVYQTWMSGNDLDLNRLFGLESSAALGTARFEVDATGTGSETSSVVGAGKITLSEGTIPDLPVLDQVEEFIGLHLAGTRYESATIDFTLGDDRVQIAPFEIVSDLMRLQAAGSIDSQGALEGRAQVFVPREDVDLGSWQGDLSEALIDALTDESGQVSIPLLIGGNVEEPRVAPDSDALLAALQRSAGDSLGKWLQGIIKRN